MACYGKLLIRGEVICVHVASYVVSPTYSSKKPYRGEAMTEMLGNHFTKWNAGDRQERKQYGRRFGYIRVVVAYAIVENMQSILQTR